MQPKNFQFGGGSSDTVLDPLIAVAMLIAIVLILTLPRHKVITPFLLAFFAIPLPQVIVLGGVHFPAGLPKRGITREDNTGCEKTLLGRELSPLYYKTNP